MEHSNYKFSVFFWRITATHMISYMIMGIIASNLFDYRDLFENSLMSCMYRPYDSPWIAAGPVLQVIRGLVFAIALWFFKEQFLNQNYGWLKLWGLLVGLSILSTTGAPPGSIEGFIYTKFSFLEHVKGYFEVGIQTLLFSLALYYWYARPKKAWNIIAGIMVGLIAFMSTMGFLVASGIIRVD